MRGRQVLDRDRAVGGVDVFKMRHGDVLGRDGAERGNQLHQMCQGDLVGCVRSRHCLYGLRDGEV